jgi:hypothetical protein
VNRLHPEHIIQKQGKESTKFAIELNTSEKMREESEETAILPDTMTENACGFLSAG